MPKDTQTVERAPRLTRPEGMGDQEWTLLRMTRSSEMAATIVNQEMVAAVSDQDALNDFFVASKSAELDALKRWQAFARKVQPELDKLKGEYDGHASRSARLYRTITGIAVGGNGTADDAPGGAR